MYVRGLINLRKFLQPDLVLGSSILALTPEIVQQHGLRGLVLDVDETLVPIYTADIPDEIYQCIARLKPVVSLWLVSNNLSQNRIGRIADALEVPYILGARKPSRRKLRQAVTAMDIPVHQVGMVGDRLFTDVLAGNRLGMFTILVEPMVSPTQTRRFYPVHALEVWLSHLFGATVSAQQNDSQRNKRT
jgi:HAD superfamily phosphatase (TIGR01668 family)